MKWSSLLGCDGVIQASSTGRMRRLIMKGKRKTFRYYAMSRTPEGYMTVGWSYKGIEAISGAHRAIYQAFHGPIPKGMQVNHINGIPSDNRLCNLNLMTPQENCKDAHDRRWERLRQAARTKSPSRPKKG